MPDQVWRGRFFPREMIWILVGPMRYNNHFTPILPQVCNTKQVENRLIKLCDFCASSVMGSPWSVLGHLLHPRAAPALTGAAVPWAPVQSAHGDLLTLIHVLIEFPDNIYMTTLWKMAFSLVQKAPCGLQKCFMFLCATP